MEEFHMNSTHPQSRMTEFQSLSTGYWTLQDSLWNRYAPVGILQQISIDNLAQCDLMLNVSKNLGLG